MQAPARYASLKLRYPKLIAEIEAKIRNGRTRVKNDPIESFDWFIEWCTEIQGGVMTIHEVLSGVQKETKHIDHFNILATKKKNRWESSLFDEPTPKEVLILRAKAKEEQDKEDARFNALTPEQQEAEQDALLRSLGMDPGFMAFSVPKRPRNNQ